MRSALPKTSPASTASTTASLPEPIAARASGGVWTMAYQELWAANARAAASWAFTDSKSSQPWARSFEGISVQKSLCSK